EAHALGIGRGLHMLRTKFVSEQLRDRPYLGRRVSITVVGDAIRMVLGVTRETSEDVFANEMYVTAPDGALRTAARRVETGAIADIPLSEAVPVFEQEARAWLDWVARKHAPLQLVWDAELEGLLAEAESLGDDDEAVF